MKNIKIEWKTCFRVGISVFLLYLAITYWSGFSRFVGTAVGAASPLIIGGVIAFLVNILMSRYEKWFFPRSSKKFVRRMRRPLCMTAAFATLIAVIGAVVALVIPELVSCVKLLIDLLVAEAPKYFRIVLDFLDKHNLLSDEYISQLANIDWKSRIGDIFKAITSGLGSVMDVVISTVTSLFSGIVTAFISIIFSVYLLAGKERIGSQLTRLLNRFVKEVWRNRILHVASVVNDCFRKYIVGQCTEAVILGVLCALGMWVLQLPYATMIGALVAFTALIPVAGAYIGAAVGAFMILTVSPVKALVFLVFLLVLQQVEGNLIYPKVVGSSLGLPGIWVLAAVIIGGGVMGVAGMLLGVPVAAAIYKLLAEQVRGTPVSDKTNGGARSVGDGVLDVPKTTPRKTDKTNDGERPVGDGVLDVPKTTPRKTYKTNGGAQSVGDGVLDVPKNTPRKTDKTNGGERPVGDGVLDVPKNTPRKTDKTNGGAQPAGDGVLDVPKNTPRTTDKTNGGAQPVGDGVLDVPKTTPRGTNKTNGGAQPVGDGVLDVPKNSDVPNPPKKKKPYYHKKKKPKQQDDEK